MSKPLRQPEQRPAKSPPAGDSLRATRGAVGYSWPLNLFRGRGQVRLRDAVRISLGRAVREKARFYFGLPWALGFGVFASLSSRSWAYGMTSTVTFTFFLCLFSAIPWRIRFRRPRSSTFHWALLLNLLLACGIGAVVFAVAVLLPGWLFLPPKAMAWMLAHPFNWVPWSFVFPLVGLSLTISEDAEQLGRRQRKRTETLERLAEEARAAALRAQINPHFFFNALNTIAALIPVRPSDAERAVELLAEALRPALTGDQPALRTVRDELRIACAYAELETLRWGDRVRFEFVTKDEDAPGLLDTLVPSLSLQPILENAVRHGASKTPEPYRIELRVAPSEEGRGVDVNLRNAPADRWDGFDGKSLPVLSLPSGHALHNIALRLGAHFGAEARLRVHTDEDLRGWIRMTVPYQVRGGSGEEDPSRESEAEVSS